MKQAPKVMFIGLDAMSKHLVLRWANDGLLPNLKGLMETGTRGMTFNAPGVYTGSVWPTIWTGAGPGSHGCYYNEQIRPGTYETMEFLGKDLKRRPFWEELSRAGKRVCLIDVPKTPLSRELNGLQVVDWGTHDADIPVCTWPEGLLAELTGKYGEPPFRRCDWVMDEADGARRLRNELLERIERKTAMALDLMGRESWDLYMVGFGDSHCVGHQLWHLHDERHPKHDAALRAGIGDPVRDVYVALDGAVGRLLKEAGPETLVMVLCSHGMSAHYDASYLLDEVLRRLEGRPAPASRWMLDVARVWWKKLPLSFTERFAGIAGTVNRMPDGADRRERKCFVVPSNANSPGIRLNLKGREPEGKVAPGEEAERFVAELTEWLMELTEPGDGRRLVKEVVRSAERFAGEHVDLLPDLFVRWNRATPITGVASPRIGTIVRPDESTQRTGDHRSGGVYFVKGPGVAAGVRLPAGRDEDIAPTLAGWLGGATEGFEGRQLPVR